VKILSKTNMELETTEGMPPEVADESIEIKEIFLKFKSQVEELKAKRVELEKSLQDTINEIKTVQDEQLKLRDSISNLVKKEVDLNQKRIELEKQLTYVKDKYSKLIKINSELMDLWK
jgi:chromosome segregation ATPase